MSENIKVVAAKLMPNFSQKVLFWIIVIKTTHYLSGCGMECSEFALKTNLKSYFCAHIRKRVCISSEKNLNNEQTDSDTLWLSGG
jgi:hypothetical protein